METDAVRTVRRSNVFIIGLIIHDFFPYRLILKTIVHFLWELEMPHYHIKDWRNKILLRLSNMVGYLIWGWRRLAESEISSLAVHHILIIQLDEFGDVLLSTPALRYLRELFPTAQITVLLRKPGYEALKNNADINRLVLVDLPRLNASFKGVAADLRRINAVADSVKKELGSVIFDLGIDLRSDFRTIFLLHKLPVKIRVAQAIRGGGFWLTHIAPYRGVEHEVERKIGIVRDLRQGDFEPTDKRLQITISKTEIVAAHEMMKVHGIFQGDPFVVIHPFAGWREKEWPIDRFAAVIDYLRQRHGLKSVVIGSTDEHARAVDLFSLIKSGVINLVGRTNIRESAAVIGAARLFIGNDSGPMHLASAMQTPTIALFGQNTPLRYGPWENRNVTLYHRVECSPCAQTTCKRRPSCLELITLDEVKGAVDRVLEWHTE